MILETTTSHEFSPTFEWCSSLIATSGSAESARAIYERCPVEIGTDDLNEEYYLKFAFFEERNKEVSYLFSVSQLSPSFLPNHELGDQLFGGCEHWWGSHSNRSFQSGLVSSRFISSSPFKASRHLFRGRALPGRLGTAIDATNELGGLA